MLVKCGLTLILMGIPMPRVFISSTNLDLADFRREAAMAASASALSGDRSRPIGPAVCESPVSGNFTILTNKQIVN